ncbi:GILT-like protein 1 [Aethina tumida]|uniref:GILT-like protein 1 n=1 Tax=Aethina tumida TaxID=116153 RepID=UPI00096B1DEA|nr:GILT-like protein 1 [Aethina tumida]
MLKYFSVLIILVKLSVAQKLNVDVLYESLCPDSLRFITEQLYPAWSDISPYVNINFVPFGKSSSLQNGSEFVCQHGPRECRGNRLMSCALARIPDQTQQVEYVNCFMKVYRKNRKNSEEDGRQCAEKINLDVNDVNACYNSLEGTQLQLNAEKSTVRILPKFVPTVLYNGEFMQQLQDISLVNFRGLVCELIKTTYPESCKTLSILKL